MTPYAVSLACPKLPAATEVEIINCWLMKNVVHTEHISKFPFSYAPATEDVKCHHEKLLTDECLPVLHNPVPASNRK